MVWAATSVTFLATVVVLLSLVYALSASNTGVAERLTRLRHVPSETPAPHFWQEQKEKLQKVLAGVGKLVPSSPKAVNRSQRIMIRAGYRRPETIVAMRGVKLLCPIVLVGLVYFTGLYGAAPFLLVIAAVFGILLPEGWLVMKVHRRQHRLRLALPDALDLLVICVEAGLGLDQAILRVSQELRLAHAELSGELQLVNLEMRVGRSRIEALRELAVRTGVEDINALVATLVQTDRFGTSVAQSLRVHSDDLRTKRRQRAEEMAAKTTVKMVPPLVFFIFPALMVVILGPAVISVARQLLPALR